MKVLKEVGDHIRLYETKFGVKDDSAFLRYPFFHFAGHPSDRRKNGQVNFTMYCIVIMIRHLTAATAFAKLKKGEIHHLLRLPPSVKLMSTTNPVFYDPIIPNPFYPRKCNLMSYLLSLS
jgi:hypothetical protein